MTKSARKPWNPLLKLLFINGLAGILAAAVLTAGLVFADVGGFGHLVFNSASPFLPVAVLFAGLAITLASVAMGVAVMRLPFDGSEPGSPRRIKPQIRPELVGGKRELALATAKGRRR